MDPGAHYAKTPATPGLAITAADTRFTAGEKHSDHVWLHLVEAIEKHFVNESDQFADLFRLTDPTIECPEDANDLLYVTLEHLIKPGSDARAWLDSSGREFPNDGKRALSEISRRLDDQTEPLDALQLLIEIRFEARNVDPDSGIRKFNELVADAAHQPNIDVWINAMPSISSTCKADFEKSSSKELTKAKKKTAKTVPLATAYCEHARDRRDDREKKNNCGESALLGLVQDFHKELAAVRQEISNLKGERGRDQGEHDRRTFFEKNFVDKRHDRGRGQRGKGKGKGNFYRVGAKNNVDSAFHVATETFVPACMMPECVGCYHAASDFPTLSMNLYSADDDTVRRSYLAEFVTAEVQAAYDDEDDAAFDDICEHYGKAEVHKGPSANTFPSAAEPGREPSLRQQYCGLKELSARRFTYIDPPLGARSVVLEDADDTVAPPRVHFEEKLKKIVEAKTAFRTASVVHHDDRDLWRDWESPVLDMTPTQDSHFDAFTAEEGAIGETVTEDCDDVFEDAVAAEVVSDLPPESFVEDFVYRPPVRSSEIDKFYPPYYENNSLAYFEDIAAPPQPPPPRQRIGGGGRVGLLHTALFATFFFSAFMCVIEECDATAVDVQLAQPLAYEHACGFATPPAQG
ncbi:hypothetical protein CYMTET_38081 [Cymbomonas tetramitiformis]|uniref:Uncharacterized protein n=1 Tax=Cymbomonas tetramitiformis TaxID=36881 RepID=A0AAE0CEF6_9CHLO|nr:hypothetical protein CYMTET_38081 [Cymbomonas tetramitiformis]